MEVVAGSFIQRLILKESIKRLSPVIRFILNFSPNPQKYFVVKAYPDRNFGGENIHYWTKKNTLYFLNYFIEIESFASRTHTYPNHKEEESDTVVSNIT